MGRRTGIRDDHALTPPGRRIEGLQPLPAQAILMALTFRIEGGNGNRETKMVPTRHSHDHITAKGIRRRCPVARHLSPGMRSPPLGLVRGVATEGALAIGRWR
jgi:hypothetical protein